MELEIAVKSGHLPENFEATELLLTNPIVLTLQHLGRVDIHRTSTMSAASQTKPAKFSRVFS